ncbi:sterol carrier family protein [Nocardioides sp. B-3]|uniref:sterol carrier family protein n=1 Tax=Nocardioides sp. B-3 TaxID=2895565 RepID=UPI0021527EC0|nr:sterol carrier family protein [Nocardioides sp. B-3]UUZ61543.1 sterol carrier family protein [Nocardioides sp. B-3]
MPVRLRPADPDAVAQALEQRTAADDRLLTKHFSAVLAERAPGSSVEVRVPPYAAAQVIPGVRHTRGTPPAVIETDAATRIALATGDLEWETAIGSGRIIASGERTDLTAYLPLTDTKKD